MKIIKGTEPIDVEHPVFMIYGRPGIGKSSLAMSMAGSLNLDFDMGVHRAVNRRDSMQVPDWKVVDELLKDPSVLDPYQAIVADTVGRCLDRMAVDIIRRDAKLGRGGALTQQGWGQLKSRFTTFIETVRGLGKDVMLVSHDKEQDDGDVRIVRPDIQGGSLGEVMKSADFVGYLYMNGRDRVLDFNPTDRWVGKNPAGWGPMRVPEPGKATDFFAKLYTQGREALGKMTAAQADVLIEVKEWEERIAGAKTAGDLNTLVDEAKKRPPIVWQQVAEKIWQFGKSAGYEFDKEKKAFVEPKKVEEGTTAGAPAASLFA